MAPSVSQFVSFEVSLVDTPRRVRLLATVWNWAPVTVVRMEAVVHVAPEGRGSMKPRTGADEHVASKPFWAIVASWGTVIRRDVVITIGTLWCYSDVDAY
jgi:hypothetical protein